MKYALISDIHANLVALTEVLKIIDAEKVDQTLNLGDIVGYYPWPNECVDLMREREIPSIMGNHDVVACGNQEPVYFNPTATQAILWARETLRPDNRKYICGLPNTRTIGKDLLMVHGSVWDRDEYLLYRPEIEKSFLALENKYPESSVVFFGHTHRRVFYEQDGTNIYSGGKNDTLKLRKNAKYLINPGSVGQSRDGDPRASFCIYDTTARQVHFHRVHYDIDKVAGAVGKLPFGESLARRLYRGA